MIQLKYAAKTNALEEIETQLKDLSLAFKSEMDPLANTPILQEGKKVIAGIENIKTYLDQLILEINASRNAAC